MKTNTELKRLVTFWEEALRAAEDRVVDCDDRFKAIYQRHVGWCKDHLYKARADYAQTIGRKKYGS